MTETDEMTINSRTPRMETINTQTLGRGLLDCSERVSATCSSQIAVNGRLTQTDKTIKSGIIRRRGNIS